MRIVIPRTFTGSETNGTCRTCRFLLSLSCICSMPVKLRGLEGGGEGGREGGRQDPAFHDDGTFNARYPYEVA
jgi:hypothetical protein